MIPCYSLFLEVEIPDPSLEYLSFPKFDNAEHLPHHLWEATTYQQQEAKTWGSVKSEGTWEDNPAVKVKDWKE